MSTADEITAIRAAKDAATKLTTLEQELRERHAALTEDRRHTFIALKSRQDVIANTERLVTAEYDSWWADYQHSWATELSGRRELKVAGLGTDNERERIVTVPPRLPSMVGLVNAPGALTFRDLCAMAPALVIASITEQLRAMPDERFGLPDGQRSEQLAKLDAAIADVEARHSELVDAAAEVGIALALLPAVRERRQEDAKREVRERALAAARA